MEQCDEGGLQRTSKWSSGRATESVTQDTGYSTSKAEVLGQRLGRRLCFFRAAPLQTFPARSEAGQTPRSVDRRGTEASFPANGGQTTAVGLLEEVAQLEELGTNPVERMLPRDFVSRRRKRRGLR